MSAKTHRKFIIDETIINGFSAKSYNYFDHLTIIDTLSILFQELIL